MWTGHHFAVTDVTITITITITAAVVVIIVALFTRRYCPVIVYVTTVVVAVRRRFFRRVIRWRKVDGIYGCWMRR